MKIPSCEIHTNNTHEAQVEALLIKLLDERGIQHFKGRPEGMKGYPDRTVFADHEYHVETKVGKKLGSYYGQSPTQKWWQKTIEASNGYYVFLTGFDEVRNWVASIGLANPIGKEGIK